MNLFILDGMLLGDLGLQLEERRVNARARWSGKHLRTAKAMIQSLSLDWREPKKHTVFDKRTKKKYPGYHLLSLTSSKLTEQYHRWYPEGKKMVPRDIILTPETIYWWYVGDGCLYKDGRISFATQGFSRRDVEFLISLEPINRWEPKMYKNRERFIICIPRRYVGELLECIGICQNPEYAYKWDLKTPVSVHGNAKLTRRDVREVRRLLNRGKLTQKQIGERFGVTQTVISSIKTGRRWAWLDAY